MLLAAASVASMASMAPVACADDSPPPLTPEGVYMCLQNANMTGSVWHPVECRHFAVFEEQFADRPGQPVVHFDHIERNAVDSNNIWWKVDFRGVGQVNDKSAHWFCSEDSSGFSCVWQTTNNAEDWAAHNQFRAMGVTDIPSVFWVPQSLVEHYAELKPLVQRRAANEARYAKAQALAKSDAFTWSYVPFDGGACRPLGPTTPFKFMQAIGNKRRHTTMLWDSGLGDNDASQSVVGEGLEGDYQFFINAEACNAAIERSLLDGGITVSEADLQHKPAVKWLITDATVSKVACHWPSVVTGKSPKDFLAILKEQSAKISEVSALTTTTTDNRTIFEILFAYTLKGHSKEISWSDLGDYGCTRGLKDQLQLP
jgi:hypothetical protein